MVRIAKTTLYLRADLHRRLKAQAVRSARTMTELVEQGIEQVLASSLQHGSAL